MKLYALFLTLAIPCMVHAQDTTKAAKEAEYTNVLVKRADKIVATLNIKDTAVYNRVLQTVVQQYKDLNAVHDARNAKTKEVRSNKTEDKKVTEDKVAALENEANAKLYDLHCAYFAKLAVDLTPEQVEQIKDGMTYNVLPITYKGYQSMLLKATPEEFRQIKGWLTEAREHAVDAESSDKKHWWFGKYKGRIGNYLASRGYDMKKESADWAERVKKEEAAKKNK
ncbi:DUF3826 domain-containing protein [Pinibacter soli]|uniref:DUF3826 domain-containing protein n=1 Tax=Pinibacter soli TaxID=3044211 RepID=A0ABT6RH20_9BACT|nr:DUF3826 domain-containing protein [Pinibacter soli]MDI3321149.1 DUF3826 domain-containing protein [Pinibacter soli]